MDIPENIKRYQTTVDGVAVRKIFVSNLPNKLNPADLKTKFQNYGKIYDVTVVLTSPGRPKTFAFVTYYTPQDATRAIEDNYIFFRGRKLYVSPADSWHQPVELSDGNIIWDRRSMTQENIEALEGFRKAEAEGDENEEEEQEPSIVNDEAKCPISKLNDDCLHLIFDHLSINERVPLGLVCRRWRKINETMWHGIKKLDFSTTPLARQFLTNNKLQLYLSLCPNVVSLNVANPDHCLNSGAIVIIAKLCNNLEELTIRNIPIQKRSLALLAKYCLNLSAFYMNACTSHHDQEMIGLVKKCKNLQRIGLKFSSTKSGAWLKHINCPLESLSLEMYEMNPQYLIKGICRVQNTLKELSFISCPAIGCSALDAIASLVPNLTFLTWAGMFTLIRYKDLSPITKLKNLIRLDLEHNSIVCDDFMKDLVENCPSLVHLNLSGTDYYHLSEKGLNLVAKFSKLTHLRLACHDTLNDAVLKTISNKLKLLEHLDIMSCQSISDQGCVDIITNCANLESLVVSGCRKVTNATVLAAVKLVENGCRKKLRIIAGGTRVDTDVLIIKPEIRRYINIDVKTTFISHFQDFYESDYDNSELSPDDYDMFDDEAEYYDVYSDDYDDFDDIEASNLLDPQIWF